MIRPTVPLALAIVAAATLLALAVLLASGGFATPRSAEVIPSPRALGSAPTDRSGESDLRRTGAPHPANSTEEYVPGATAGSSTEQVPGGAPSPTATRTEAPVPPTSGSVGTYSAKATWCAPTPTQCQSWTGNARLGAVHSFRSGDAPYMARIWRGEQFVDVLIVSYCAGCPGGSVDLSPGAFEVLGPLSLGRIDVVVELGIEPPRSAVDLFMQEEVR